jgi:hypothetical protein
VDGSIHRFMSGRTLDQRVKEDSAVTLMWASSLTGRFSCRSGRQ